MINFAVAEPRQIETAFKNAGLDELPENAGVISSVGMAHALKRAGYQGLTDINGFIKAVR